MHLPCTVVYLCDNRIEICCKWSPLYLTFWGSNSEVFCEGRQDPRSTKSGPSSARQRNAIIFPFFLKTPKVLKFKILNPRKNGPNLRKGTRRFENIRVPCRATKCCIHNMLSRGAYCVPCIHNMLPFKSGAYCVGHVSYLHNMLPS